MKLKNWVQLKHEETNVLEEIHKIEYNSYFTLKSNYVTLKQPREGC